MTVETNAGRAYRHLRSKLLAGEFEPGTRLLYGPIGKELGISATPVREAVGQLVNEGLVDLVPQLGAIVRKIDRDELIELYEVREAIEPYAAARAAERAATKQLNQIKAQVDRMLALTEQLANSSSEFANKRMTAQFEKADFAFHMLIIEATGNQALARTAVRSHVLTRVFGIRRHRYDVATMRSTCDDHLQILTAIQAGDVKKSRSASATHISRGLKASLKAIDES
ncbi:GntR family transcriptional regulator [Rosistilla oblonga]|uniref:GntR family transcriptional regulator n=1 Tax=Rosistilla oblonga TaxID=2527990 RepID=UPI003A9840ED